MRYNGEGERGGVAVDNVQRDAGSERELVMGGSKGEGG